ncbi:MAG: hypothetical protein ACI3XC_09610 [Phascolarctobacterium sp.]
MPEAAKVRGKKSGQASGGKTTDPKFMESLRLCEIYEQLREERWNSKCEVDHIGYEIGRLNEEIKSLNKKINDVQGDKNAGKAFTIMVSAVWFGFAILGCIINGLSKDTVEGLGAMFLIWLLFFLWRILSANKYDSRIAQYKKEIEEKTSAIKEEEAKLPELEAKFQAKEKHLKDYEEAEMGKCIIPKDCWMYADQMRNNVMKGCTDLETALIRLAKDNSELRIEFREKE